MAIVSRYPEEPDRPRGGVQAVTVVLARALARLGDLDVHVVTVERGRRALAIQRNGPVTVHRLPAPTLPLILEMLGGPGHRAAVRYITHLRADVVHTHEAYGRALRSLRLPQVATVHGFEHANLVTNGAWLAWLRSPVWYTLERAGWIRQTHIISITPYVRQMIEPVVSAQIFDIENPVDERFFEVRRHEEAGRVLCVGWISERKNTVGSVRAFARALTSGAHGVLVIAGTSTEPVYARRVRECIEESGVGPRVEWRGHLNRKELLTELARASVLLLPSRQENAPMAIEEAMAAGVPVIASNRCGMPFMVDHGRSGFLVDPEDTEDIASRLEQILGNDDLRTKMGLESRRIALERFHPEKVAQRTRRVYEIAAGTQLLQQ